LAESLSSFEVHLETGLLDHHGLDPELSSFLLSLDHQVCSPDSFDLILIRVMILNSSLIIILILHRVALDREFEFMIINIFRVIVIVVLGEDLGSGLGKG
jgi:hypothetical protein